MVKLRNGNINSVVEASLSIPSDFVILEGGLELISRDFLYVYVQIGSNAEMGYQEY